MKKIICSIILGLLLITDVMCTNTIEAKAETSLDNMDYNLNSVIDIEDLADLAAKYNVTSDNTKWESKYDLNGDGIIDIYDIVQMSKEMGSETPTIRDNKDITSKFIDANFKNEVYFVIRKNSPAPILYADVKNVRSLGLALMNINNLSGIEYFTGLVALDCHNNKLTSLDVSKNTALTRLDCCYNGLTSLDVSKNTALTMLYCYNNGLTSLDVSENTALTMLYCYNNGLTSLDVSKNTALTYLDCSFNKITSLDISKNTSLTFLDCRYNKITSLEASNKSVITLYCTDNQLTSLDVSNNTSLRNLGCNYNQLTTFYSYKEWDDVFYKTQYTDANHTTTTTNLTITIKN